MQPQFLYYKHHLFMRLTKDRFAFKNMGDVNTSDFFLSLTLFVDVWQGICEMSLIVKDACAGYIKPKEGLFLSPLERQKLLKCNRCNKSLYPGDKKEYSYTPLEFSLTGDNRSYAFRYTSTLKHICQPLGSLTVQNKVNLKV